MKNCIIPATLGGLLMAISTALSQDFVAFQVEAGQAGNQSAGASLGLDFNVTGDITVNRLGCFDDSGDGLVNSITVELWSRNDGGTPEDRADDFEGNILASLVFDSASPGTLEGGHLFKDLTAPLELSPGAYTIVAYGFSDDDQNYNTNFAPGVAPLSTETGDSIEYIGRRYGQSGSYPTNVDGGLNARYAAGTFSFQLLDSDADGMPDFWEDLFSLNKNDAGDAASDLDGDTLTNLEEYDLGTNPEEDDSDSDASLDADEIANNTDPSQPDSDFDGILDGAEDNTGTFSDEDSTGTNPLEADSDMDGYDDGAELELLSDPTDADSTPLQDFGEAAYSVSKSAVGNQAATAALGLDFDVDGLVSIGYLGAFDNGSDGFTNPITVEIWERDNGGTPDISTDDTGVGAAPITQVIIAPGEGFLQGGNRFKALPEPFVIDTGSDPSNYTLVAYGFSAADQNVNTFGQDAGASGLSVSNNIALNFTGTSRFAPGGATGVFPSNADTGPAHRYAAGTFAFTTEDADGDRMPDFWENLYGLNPNSPADALLDGDADNLNNLEEFQNDLSPNDPDFDNDNLIDGDEIAAGTNPRNPDSDGDTLEDGDEVLRGTNPLAADTDNDDFTDNFEIAEGTAPDDDTSFPNVRARGDLAYSSVLGAEGNQTNFRNSAGLDFVVNSPITVSELGAFDSGSNGFIGEITVQLWSRDDFGTAEDFGDDIGESVLAEVIFGPANRGILRDGHRTRALTSPILLPAGSYTIVASGFGEDDPMGNAGFENAPVRSTIEDEAISFVGGGRFLGTPATFPTNADAGPPNRYAAGTFAFNTPSEETTITGFSWDADSDSGSITFSSIPNTAYEVEYSTNLSGASWIALDDLTATESETTFLVNSSPSHGATKLFFRIRKLD